MKYKELKEIQKQIPNSEIIQTIKAGLWKYGLIVNGLELNIKKRV